MKKTILCLLVLICMMFSVATVCYADDNEATVRVYAPKSVQDFLYQATQSEDFDQYDFLKSLNLSIVKETITKVYTLDFLEYSVTNHFELKPSVVSNRASEEEQREGNEYIAKLVTADGEHAGNIFLHKIGNVVSGDIDPAPILQEHFSDTRFRQSCSYADHAERIKQILGTEEFVSAADVAFIRQSNIGLCFLINHQGKQVAIPIGYYNPALETETDYIYSNEKLKEISDWWVLEDKAYWEIKAEYEKEYPDFPFFIAGDNCCGIPCPRPIIAGCSTVNNIQNIYEYLNEEVNSDEPIFKGDSSPSETTDNESKDVTENSKDPNTDVSTATGDETDKNGNALYLVGIIGLALIIGSAVTVAIFKRKKKT
ncbi:MAG: hypothetical protein IKU23_05140 [Clostridia bacterium]|nr:hypothetical protein [Clostridia bacterium]